mgnify:FL=1
MSKEGMGPLEIGNRIDERLKHFQNMGDISEMERDALRHYYGARAVSKAYGTTLARIGGWMHEGLDSIFPWENDAQRDADLYNNELAFSHIKEGIGSDFDLTQTSAEDLKETLKILQIPPPLLKRGEY